MHEFLRMLGRRLPIVLIAALGVSSTMFAYSLSSEKQYTSTAKLLFRDPEFDQKLFGSTVLAPSRDPAREAATNLKLASLETISARAAQVLGPDRLTASDIRRFVRVEAEGVSDVVRITAEHPSPTFAALVANTVAKEYIGFRRKADRTSINEALTLVRRQLARLTPQERSGPQGRSASARVGQLEILGSLQTGNAELVQPAVRPREASSPKPARDGIVGLIVGLLLGIGLAILLDRLDRRLRDGSDAEAILKRPILGLVPQSRAFRRDDGMLHIGGSEGESFRSIRMNLRYFGVDRDVRSLVITSAVPGEGKTTVARYLAATAAASGVSTVLLEADLRRPTLASVYPKLIGHGLTSVLSGVAPLADVIQQVHIDVPGSGEDNPVLDLVMAGPIPPNPTHVLESARMTEVLTELELRYDLVVVDTSPITIVSDTLPIISRASGMVIVVRAGTSTRSRTRMLRKHLDNLSVSPLGIILNGVSAVEGGAYGYYGYGAAVPESDGDAPEGNGRRWLPGSRQRQDPAGKR